MNSATIAPPRPAQPEPDSPLAPHWDDHAEPTDGQPAPSPAGEPINPSADTRASRAAQRARTAKKSRRRKRRRVLIPLLLVLAGVVTLLYPVVATRINNERAQEFAEMYNSQIQQVDSRDLGADLASARDYNSHLPGVPILDPWLLQAASDPGSVAYRDYSSQLSRFSIMARIKVPSAGIDLPVHHGTSQEVLNQGAGHLYGTALPVGGVGTHAVLTSHTGLPNATLFDHLVDVAEGDLMLVEVSGATLAYRVDQIKVVLPSEIGDLTSVEGHDYLTLFTCTPYGVNSHRLLVRGERVPYTPEVAEQAQAEQRPAAPFEPWMLALMGVATTSLVGLVAVVRRDRRGSVGSRRTRGRHAQPKPDRRASRAGKT